MSEREPITTELRRVMNHTTMAGVPLVEIGEYEFAHRCDEIDAVHAALERENAELRERVAVLDESADSMHDGGSITDELRKYANRFKNSHDAWSGIGDDLTAIADHIDAEHEDAVTAAHSNGITKYGSMVAREYVKLPVDADGVPWHIGDVTESGQTVEAMGLNGHGWHFVGTVNEIDPAIHRHYHAPTVEDVLREFASDIADVLGGDDFRLDDSDELFAEYAAKLRLAGDAE